MVTGRESFEEQYELYPCREKKDGNADANPRVK
jgi:hypothetical protein